MSAITSPTPSASRPRPAPVVLAVALSALIIVGNLVSPALPLGEGDNKVPAFVIILGAVLGLLGIVAAIGLWLLRRWGMILTLAVTVVNLLSTVPGVAFGPAAWIKVLAAVSVLVCIAIIVLVLLPEARRAYR